MNISKIKLVITALTGGVAGIIEYLLDLFNDQVLAKIKDKETGLMYLKDVRSLSTCAKEILENHSAQMSEAKTAAGQKTVDALDELAKALEDFKLEPDELDAIVEKVKAAVEAWKAAK